MLGLRWGPGAKCCFPIVIRDGSPTWSQGHFPNLCFLNFLDITIL